jgi:hypothetical protein
VLRWPIKASLIEYVRALPDGRIDLADGVRMLDGPDGTEFEWRVCVGDGPTSSITFPGRIRFFGHRGLMDVRLESLRLEGDGRTLGLSVEEGAALVPQRSIIAQLATYESLDRPDLDVHGVPVLTFDGSRIFEAYQIGQRMDRLRLYAEDKETSQ